MNIFLNILFYLLSVMTNFPDNREKPNSIQTPRTHNQAHHVHFSIIWGHSHKKNELRGVRNKKVRWWWYFFVYATFFVPMQHTPIKLNGNGLLSSKALRNRSQFFWEVSQNGVTCGCYTSRGGRKTDPRHHVV